MPPAIELNSAYASTVGEDSFLVEETSSLEDPRLSSKGNLYIVGEGVVSEVAGTIKAIRDQYFGDVSTDVTFDPASALQEAIEAANSLLSRQNAIGVSLVCSVIYDNKLVVMHVGDCRAYLYSGDEGAIEPLTSQTSAYAALGTQVRLATGFAGRILKDKDILILCSGSLADSLREEEIARIVGATSGADFPEEIAERLVTRSNSYEEGVGATAVVVTCKGMFNAEPTFAETILMRAPVFQTERIPVESKRVESSETVVTPRSGERKGLPGKKVAGIAGVLSVALAAFYLGGRGFNITDYLGADFGRPSASVSTDRNSNAAASATALADDSRFDASSSGTGQATDTTAGSLERTWQQIDVLWRKGEAGDSDAWQEIVALLEQIQLQQPADPKVDEKLGSARINLAYTQKKKEVESYWGNGDTTVGTVGSWSRIVEILESLYRLKLPPDAALYVKDRLYTAHINYGKALESGNRGIEAKGQYERARQIYPNRPEAQDALKRLK